MNLSAEHPDLCFYGQYFDRHFQTVYRNDACDMPLNSYCKCATFTLLDSFQILYGFRTISNILNTDFTILSVSVQYLGRHFQTAHRIDAKNMSLDRNGNCSTFTLLSGFEITHGFKTIFNILNTVFTDLSVFILYFRRHFQTVCRIDASNTPLESCGKYATFLSLANFQNSLRFKRSFENTNSVFLISRSSGFFFLQLLLNY